MEILRINEIWVKSVSKLGTILICIFQRVIQWRWGEEEGPN
jgi:hypothetical protein